MTPTAGQAAEVDSNKITLQDIRRAIPTECFVKSTAHSLWYLVRDCAILATAPLAYPLVAASGNPLLYMAYWNFYGFFMWCLFVVGHDCGHTTFSPNKLLNDVVGCARARAHAPRCARRGAALGGIADARAGLSRPLPRARRHIAHAPLLVPFYPWAMSHRRHHMYHNHQKKDASHPWFTKASLKKLPGFTQSFLKSPLAPFLAYPIYLFEGSFDGSHVNPLSKLYRGSSMRSKLECVVSALSVGAFFAGMYAACGYSARTMALAYGGCYFCFSFWLFMVTFLQHHDHGTLVYDDSDWSFLKGAFETVDRVYGFGLDQLQHHISDGHVVHHLFFTQVPHYNLPKVRAAAGRPRGSRSRARARWAAAGCPLTAPRPAHALMCPPQATEAVAPLLKKAGVYKKVTHDNYLRDFWNTFTTCNFTGWKWANGKAN